MKSTILVRIVYFLISQIWDHEKEISLISFDLGDAVHDVAWAPFSSSVFAAITGDGRVCVFDLSQNKLKPLCDQKIVKKAKLTRISFGLNHRIVLVGDDRGVVNLLKLSPNLRSVSLAHAENTTGECNANDCVTGQKEKVDKILSAMELPSLP